MNADSTPSTTIPRRTLARGAAWSAPALVAATATPAMAASPTVCPTCLQAGTASAFTAQAITVLGLSNVTFAGGFNLDSSSCPIGIFQPAYSIVGIGGTITWNEGPATNFVSAQTGLGTLGAISAFGFTGTLFGVNMPNDALPPYRKFPTRFCFDFTSIFIPLLPIPQISCSYRICYDVTTTSIGTVVLGTGTVNWTGTFSNGTLTQI